MVDSFLKVDSACYQGFRYTVQAIGTLDALLSLAAVAKLPGYIRPVYRPPKGAHVGDEARDGSGGSAAGESEPDAIVLRGARHPTVERVLEGGFVPNDVDLRCARENEDARPGSVPWNRLRRPFL